MAWSFLLDRLDPNKADMLTYPFWYNPQISKEPLFYSHWYRAGIKTALDLLNNDGTIKTQEEIKHQFNIETNFLEYIRIEKCLKKYLTNCDVNMVNSPRPFLPPN